MRLSSSAINGMPNPNMAFGIENLESIRKPELEADVYIEAFGCRIIRPRRARYGPTIDDLELLVEWLSQYLDKVTEVHRPFGTMEPAFGLTFSRASGSTTEVSARLQAYGTVDAYYDTQTGPAITFETTNETISRSRQQLIDELKVLAQ